MTTSGIFIALKTKVLSTETDLAYKKLLPLLKSIPLIIAVIFSFLLASKNIDIKIEIGIIIALLLFLLGDYLIDKNFIQGMASFGIGHIAFITSFLVGIINNKTNLTDNFYYIIGLIIAGVIIYDLIFIKYLTTLQVPEKYFKPIIVYILLISVTFLSITSLAFVIDVRNLIILPLGAVLLILSDSTIAIREFGSKDMKYSVIKVMVPYYIAIFCFSLTTMYV